MAKTDTPPQPDAIELLKPHTHADVAYDAGDVLKLVDVGLDAGSAQWLVDIETARWASAPAAQE